MNLQSNNLLLYLVMLLPKYLITLLSILLTIAH